VGQRTAYLLAALLVVTVVGRFRPVRETQTSVRADMTEGLRWLRNHRLLRTLMVTTALSATIQSMVGGVLVLYALQDLGVSERGYGLVLAAAGVGAIIGSMLSPAVTRLLGRTTAMGASGVVSALGLVAMALWQQPVPATLGFAVSAGGVSMFNVQIMSVRQALIPEALFGRVQGAYRTVIWGGIPLGTLAGGAVGSWLGLPAVFLVSGVGGTAIGILVWMVLHTRRHEIARGFDED
jgi:predicted MFS family arabinose efflux permease